MKRFASPQFLAAALFSGVALLPLSAATLSLSGTAHTGYIALANVNNEAAEPGSGTSGAKPTYGMPYYYDSSKGLWSYLVTTPRSSTSDYSGFGYTVSNGNYAGTNTVISGATWSIAGSTGGTPVATDFGTTNFGSLAYDTSSLIGSGVETITVAASSFTFDLLGISPKYTLDNQSSNNEFNWDYAVQAAAGNVSLTFTGGVLTSIDGVVDVGISVRFGGVPLGAFRDLNTGEIATYDGTLTFSGDTFAWNVDETVSVSSFLGTLTDSRLVFNRAGTIDGVSSVPETSSVILSVFAAAAFFRRRR